MPNKKACSFDGILNEMIKCRKEITKIFNHLLHCEIFPRIWSEGYIVPLFKKGDRLNPTNYRGITISFCPGKLLTKIMIERFLQFLEINKIITPNQAEFSPDKRTVDHIYVLKTLLDEAKHNKSHLYLCFVDLKSAFDTVWRDGLLYKLYKIKVSAKCIPLISNMYSKVTGKVRTREGYTQDFPIHVVTKQGCNLSPSLFNCYINDLPEVLDNLNAHQPFLLEQKKADCCMQMISFCSVKRQVIYKKLYLQQKYFAIDGS